eukprot:13945375-Ditylum_brightwellii.AAC.1
MIEYPQHRFGIFSILFRLRGSALVQAILPAFLSTLGLYLWVTLGSISIANNATERPIFHPYAIGLTWVTAGKAHNISAVHSHGCDHWQYWEAATDVHQMLSKWLDVGIQLGAFHRQAASYDDIRPPAFGHYPHIQNLSATRKRHQASLQNLKDQIDDAIDSNDYPAQRLLKDPR